MGGKISSVPWWGSVLTWGHCVTVGGKISSVPWWGSVLTWGR